MRNRILTVILLLVACYANAASRITATVTITNAPAGHDTITVNGDIRLWTNSVSTVSTQILIGADSGLSASNLYSHAAQYLFTGPLIISRSGTNGVVFTAQTDQALVITATAGYCTVSYTTQAVSVAYPVRVPNTVESLASRREYIASEIANYLGLSTQAVSQVATAMQNYANLGTAQTLSNKTLRVGTFIGGTVNGSQLTNVVGISGVIGGSLTSGFIHAVTFYDSIAGFTNGTLSDVGITSGNLTSCVHRGNAFISEGAGGNTSLALGFTASATGLGSVGVGYSADSTAESAAAFGEDALASAPLTAALGPYTTASGDNSVAIGYNATASGTNSVALGTGAATSRNSHIQLGTASTDASIGQDASIGRNLGVGSDFMTVHPAGLVGGITLTNGSGETSVNPTNAASIWAASGELKYRTSGASEGAGANNRVHNRGAEVSGSGSDYTLTTSYARVDFGGTDPQIALPSAGTYLLTYVVTCNTGLGGGDDVNFKLYDSTAAADIANSESHSEFHVNSTHQQFFMTTIATVTGANTIQIYGKNATSARGSAEAVHTKIQYVRLY